MRPPPSLTTSSQPMRSIFWSWHCTERSDCRDFTANEAERWEFRAALGGQQINGTEERRA